MSTIIDLMLGIRKGYVRFYHKDTNTIDGYPISPIELKELEAKRARQPDGDADEAPRVLWEDKNNFMLPSYEEIDHKEIMRFYVRECVEDPAIRKQLFDILRRGEYMDLFLNKLRELELYEDFEVVCGDIYIQIFDEWAKKYGLEFS